MTLSRTRRSTPTVLLALLLVLVLAFQRPAEALVEPVSVVLAPSGAVALGMATSSSAVASYAALGGVAAVATGAAVVVAAGAVGALVGWGVVESGLWDWATTGSTGEPTDPVAGTSSGMAWVGDLGIEVLGYSTSWQSGVGHDWGESINLDLRFSEGLSFANGGNAEGYNGFMTSVHEWCIANTPRTSATSTNSWSTTTAKTTGEETTTGWMRCGPGAEAPLMPQDSVLLYLTKSDGTSTQLGSWTEGEPVADRQLVTQADCTDPATSAVTTVTESSALYAPGSEPLSPGVVCPLGTFVSDLTITRKIDGGDGSEDETIFTATPTVPLTATEYDNCLDGSCVLMLHRLNPDGTTSDCSEGAVTCVGWITDTDRHLNYRCMWGTHVMPLDDCEMFHAIDTDAQTGTATQPDTKVDSDLTTTTDVAVGPTTEGEAEAGCSPWAWINPFSGGIAQGVACALEWAAVPDTAVVTQHLTTLDTELMTKVPFAYADLIAPVVQGIPAATMSACAGNLWDLTPEDTRPGFDSVKERHGDGLLAVPCTPPSWWTPVDLLLTSMVVVGTAWGLWNIVGAAVGGPRDGGGDGDG